MSGGFTASQWVELEHQALIFKYLMAGVPVPPDLLLPIRRSFDPLQSPNFYHHSSLGYYAYYGKKLDPEPWRCRRTDGKKWRCAKEAYPDSKYCERHMHRGRNRSRKPVESSSNPNSISTTKAPSPPATSSLLTSVLNPASPRGFDPLSAPTAVSGNSGSQGLCLGGSTSTHGYLNRYSDTLKPESGEHHFFSEPSGTAAYGTVDSAMNSLSSCKSRDTHALGGLSYSSYGDPMQEELGQVVTISSLPREQEKPPPHSFMGYGFRHEEPVKPENQLLRPFFDEWPKNRESWLEFESETSNRNSSFSTTRLSISIPMGSSASSPNDG